MRSNMALGMALVTPIVLGWTQPPQERPGQEGKIPRQTQPKDIRPGDALPPRPGSIATQEDVTFREALAAQEKRIWDSMKAGDWRTVEAMCSDRFVSVCPAGFLSKTASSEMGKTMKLSAYTLSDWKSIKIDENTGMIIYKADCTMTPPEGGSDKGVSYHSTLWRREGNSWLADMHQVTKEESSKR